MTAKKATRNTAEQDEQELETMIVENMTKAHDIVVALFNVQGNDYATEFICDYLDVADDETELVADLKRWIEHAKTVYKTTAPTPEQTLGLFEKRFPNPNED